MSKTMHPRICFFVILWWGLYILYFFVFYFGKEEMKFYLNQTILLADLQSIQKVPILHYDKPTKTSANNLMRHKIIISFNVWMKYQLTHLSNWYKNYVYTFILSIVTNFFKAFHYLLRYEYCCYKCPLVNIEYISSNYNYCFQTMADTKMLLLRVMVFSYIMLTKNNNLKNRFYNFIETDVYRLSIYKS